MSARAYTVSLYRSQVALLATPDVFKNPDSNWRVKGYWHVHHLLKVPTQSSAPLSIKIKIEGTCRSVGRSLKSVLFSSTDVSSQVLKSLHECWSLVASNEVFGLVLMSWSKYWGSCHNYLWSYQDESSQRSCHKYWRHCFTSVWSFLKGWGLDNC